MLETVISSIMIAAGIAVFIVWILRRALLSTRSQTAVIASMFGLFAIAKLAGFQHDIGGIAFEVGTALLLAASAFGQLRASGRTA
ncbi:MAG TPA: hypothetical protein VF503_32695 [Sphingobium sp.]|uniref:hypothetical protein n=1 Tax=Sphingobium sp. TaxID=1912891 RepID=UPI002ED2C50A